MKRGLLVLLVALCAATPAYGQSQTTLDPDDTDGPLDLVAAQRREMAGHPHGPRLRLKLVTFEAWGVAQVAGRKNYASFEFNTDDDSQAETCVVVTAAEPREGEAPGYDVSVYRDCGYPQSDPVLASARWRRPDEHSLVVSVREADMVPGPRARSYRWRAVTSFEDPAAGEGGDCWPGTFPTPGRYGVCVDFARWMRGGIG